MLMNQIVRPHLIEYLIENNKIFLDFISHLNSPRTSIKTVDARRIITLSI
jgi:hypothetical protein